MKKSRGKIKRESSAYERWHHHPAHRVVHWLAFLAVAGLAGYVFVNDVRTGLGQADVGPLAPPSLPVIKPASSGRIVGVAPDHILAKFKPSATAADVSGILSRHGLKEQSVMKQIGVHLLTVPPGSDPTVFAAHLKSEEGDRVEFAEPDLILSPGFIPNDPWFANWQKDKVQMNAPAAWDASTGSGSQIIAIADTGVDCTHEDLAPDCVAGWNFYDNNADASDVYGHGTETAGVAAAIGNNGVGVAGVAWQPKIMPLRVSAPDGSASVSTIADAVVYAADHGAKVVNNSYQSGGSATVQSAGNYLRSKGGLLVVSEGNYGANTGNAASADVISVSAVDPNDALYSWSSFGNDVDVAAPGCTGATTVDHGGYGNFCGTSNAAPEVSGTLMLVWAANPALTPDQAQSALFSSAKDLGTAGWDPSFGWGRIDAAGAVSLATGGAPPPPPPPPGPSLTITSYQAAGKTAASEVISWTTDQPSTGTVSFGASSTNLNSFSSDTVLGTSHSLTLTGLQKAAKYYFKITATASDGVTTAETPIASFRTRSK